MTDEEILQKMLETYKVKGFRPRGLVGMILYAFETYSKEKKEELKIQLTEIFNHIDSIEPNKINLVKEFLKATQL